MRRLYVVGEDEHDEHIERDLECNAVLRLNVGLDDVRVMGNLAHQNRAAFHGIEPETYTKVHFDELVRGDNPMGTLRNTLFVTNSDDPEGNSPSSLVVRSLSLKTLEAEANRFFNSTDPKPEMSSLVSALTVDGRGGRFTYDRNRFYACMLYYLENMYASTLRPMVDRVTLDRIGVRQSSGFVPNHPSLMPAQRASFEDWLHGYYLPKVAVAPTKRPVTERYYQQLKEEGLSFGEERDIGEDFFTDYIWRLLESKQSEILRVARSA